jgi:transcriptional regulator with XRE-family HTH domain
MSRASHSPERKRLEAQYLNKYFSKAKVLQKNLTRTKLAMELGISLSAYSQWTSGRTRIPDRHWLYLAKRLGFSAFEMRPELASAYVSYSALDLAAKIDSLDEKKKGLVISFVYMLDGIDI